MGEQVLKLSVMCNRVAGVKITSCFCCNGCDTEKKIPFYGLFQGGNL